MYDDEMGDVEETMIRQAAQDDSPIPDKILNAPELMLGLNFYYQAFLTLDTERIDGMGKGRIPDSKIVEYSNRAGVSEYVHYCLLHHVRALDNAYLKLCAKKQEQKEKADAANAKRSSKKVR